MLFIHVSPSPIIIVGPTQESTNTILKFVSIRNFLAQSTDVIEPVFIKVLIFKTLVVLIVAYDSKFDYEHDDVIFRLNYRS